jgi:hypothetical protein
MYSWASQKKIQQLVEDYHKMRMSNRTLNRDLRWLEDNGYISRLRRIHLDPTGRFVFSSTLYKFTGKLFNWLYGIGNRVKRLFSFFRLPKWADHKLTQIVGSSTTLPGSVEKVLIKERDGTLATYNLSTGEYLRRS